MELVNIWEDYIRISLGWKITTLGEKKASLQLFWVHDFAGWFFPFGENSTSFKSYWSRIDPRSLRDTAVSQFLVKFA